MISALTYKKGPISTRRLRRGGFTLIELLVSVAIFSVIMTMALGALLSLSVADRKAQTLKSAIDNLTFGLDSMSRAIRTGSNYHCLSTGTLASPQDCNATGGNYLTFLSSTNLQTFYRLETLAGDPSNAEASCNQTAPNVGCIQRSIDGGVSWQSISSPDIVVQNNGYLFHVVGSAPSGSSDFVQPKVIITLSGIVQVTPTQNTSFNMQTTVTQRIYDQ